MGKGGKRHFPKPNLDAGLVLVALKANMDLVVDLGCYETLSRTSACSPQGIVNNLALLRSFLKLEPSGEIHTQPLKAALLRLLTDDPSLNKSRFNGTVWINLRQERITCLLYHFRKLARDPDGLRLCAVRLTGSDYCEMKSLLSMLELRDVPAPTRLFEDPAGSEVGSVNGTVAYADFEELPQTRTLKKEISAASVDSDGFPMMLQTPDERYPSTLRHRLGTKTSEENWKKKQENKELKLALGFGLPSSSSKTKPLVKGPCSSSSSSKTKPLVKGTLVKGPTPLVKGKWLKLSKTTATHPERSYILGKHEKNEKMKLIVEVPRTWSEQYSFVIDKILQELREKSITKDEARELRLTLCNKYP